MAGITSNRVSRLHAEVNVRLVDNAEGSGRQVHATLTPRGTNSMFLVPRRGKEKELLKGKPAELRDGDTFFLFQSSDCKRNYEFSVSIPPDPVVSSSNNNNEDNLETPATVVISGPEQEASRSLVDKRKGDDGAGNLETPKRRRSSVAPMEPRSNRPAISLQLTKEELDECTACELPATQDLVESFPSNSAGSLKPLGTQSSVGAAVDRASSRPLDVNICYRNVDQRLYQRLLTLAPNAPNHDGRAWNVWFNLYKTTPSKLKGLRMLIQWQTMLVVHVGRYVADDGVTTVALDRQKTVEACTRTLLYQNLALSSEVNRLPPLSESKCHIDVVERDCLVAASQLQVEGFSVAVLNMANAQTPGGGYLGGAGAQEENLMRRSGLCICLDDPTHEVAGNRSDALYPIPECGAIYSPNVPVFRGPESDGYPFLSEPFQVSVISAAADWRPPLERDSEGDLRLQFEAAAKMKRKIRMILDVGVKHGHDALVLSAFGCGAFGNPPKHVAKLFREVIFSFGYQHRFKLIFFAIFNDHNSFKKHNPEGNLAPFQSVFFGMNRKQRQ